MTSSRGPASRSRAAACSSAALPATSTRSTPGPAACIGRSTPAPSFGPPSASGPLGTTGRFGAFFGDARGNAYAVDAATGALVWKVAAETFPSARLTGSPILHEGRLYVPVSSSEEGVGSLTDYECCRFRGSVVALDAATGRRDLEDLHHSRRAAAGAEERQGRAVVGAVGRADLVEPGGGSRAPHAVRHHRQQLQRPDDGDERRLHGDGPRDRPHPVDAPGDGARRLRVGVPPHRQDELSRGQRPGLRLRRLAHPRGARQRPPRPGGGPQIGQRLRRRSGSRGRAAVGNAGRRRRIDGRRAVGIGCRCGSRLRGAVGPGADHAELHAVHRRRSHARRRHVRAAPCRRRARVAHAARAVRQRGRAAVLPSRGP